MATSLRDFREYEFKTEYDVETDGKSTTRSIVTVLVTCECSKCGGKMLFPKNRFKEHYPKFCMHCGQHVLRSMDDALVPGICRDCVHCSEDVCWAFDVDRRDIRRDLHTICDIYKDPVVTQPDGFCHRFEAR